MRTWMIVALASAAIVGLGIAYTVSTGGLPVETAIVRQADIRQFIDERGKTRLPRTYAITMPYDGRIEPIDLVEGTFVRREQTVARIVPRDLDQTVKAAAKVVERLEAAVRENDDTSVESTGLQQSLD